VSADLGPGDWVEAVRSGRTHLTRGRIYLVERTFALHDGVWCDYCSNGKSGSREIVTVTQLPGQNYCPCAFRPVYRPKGTFAQLLERMEPV
jgi:hypothetical protein